MGKITALITVGTICAIASATFPPIVVSEFCELINERKYLISRIEKLIGQLDVINRHHALPLPTIASQEMKHPVMRQLVADIIEKKSTEPFFTLWENLASYHSIHDILLIKEFAQFTLLLTQKFYSSLTSKNASVMNSHDILFNLSHLSYTEALTLRFYYKHRLKKALELLPQIPCKKKSFFEFSESRKGCNCIFSSTVKFSHPEITACIKNMDKTGTLDALITLSQEFSHYKLIQDDLFTKEFMLVILCSYKNLITNNFEQNRTSSFDRVVTLYDQIQSLPLEQILATIDILTQELPFLLQQYHFYSYHSWKKWVKKYWWVPPVVGITIGLKILLRFQRPSYLDFMRYNQIPIPN